MRKAMTRYSKPQAVLFDLDGTLIDTAPDFSRVLNQLRLQHKLTALSYEAVRSQVSNGARALTTLAFGDADSNPDFDFHLNSLLDQYLEGLAEESRLFDGLEYTLQQLQAHAIPWGIVTNKPSRYTHPLLKGLGLEQTCAVTICPDDVTHRKPHPEPILKACGLICVDPAKSVYVGDHTRDIESGRNAHCFTIAAGWGYLNEGEQIESWMADLNCPGTQDFNQWLDACLSN
jgi:phosphoglycolate phosphatase